MLNAVCSEVAIALKQQGEAGLRRSTCAVLEWGCSLWIVSRGGIAAFMEQNGHEKVVLGIRTSAVSGALVSRQAKIVYSSCSAKMQMKV